jgi:hypothetical protein
MAAVLWTASVQKGLSNSIVEAEYYNLGTAGQDAIFLRELLATIDLEQAHPIVVFEDNTACLSNANNPVTNKRARHIKYNYIR